MSSAEQCVVSVAAHAGIQILGYFGDYVGMESVEWAEGISQVFDVAGCLEQLFINAIHLKSQNRTVIVNPPELATGQSLRYSPSAVDLVQGQRTGSPGSVRESLCSTRRRVARGKALAQGISTSMGYLMAVEV